MKRDVIMMALAERLGLPESTRAAIVRGDVQALASEQLGSHPLWETLRDVMEPSVAREGRESDHEARAVAAEDALASAHLVIEYIAGVLGACACFGEEPTCRRCHGNGTPGFRPSRDVQTLITWVAPTLAASGMRVGTR